MSEWIPTSERLPELDEEVLATAKYNTYKRNEDGKYIMLDAVVIVWLHKNNDYIWFSSDDDFTYMPLEDVTAWMPLPKAYKREKESDE